MLLYYKADKNTTGEQHETNVLTNASPTARTVIPTPMARRRVTIASDPGSIASPPRPIPSVGAPLDKNSSASDKPHLLGCCSGVPVKKYYGCQFYSFRKRKYKT